MGTPMVRRVRVVLVLVGVLALALAGCGGDSGGDDAVDVDPALVTKLQDELGMSAEEAECVVDILDDAFEGSALTDVMTEGGEPVQQEFSDEQTAALAEAAECTAPDEGVELDVPDDVDPDAD